MDSYHYSAIGTLEAGLEPGDRVEVGLDPNTQRLVLPADFEASLATLDVLEDSQGNPLETVAADGLLVVRGWGEMTPQEGLTVWLEFREPGRFRLIVEEPTSSLDGEEFQTEQGVPILSDPRDGSLIRGGPKASATLAEVELALRAARLSTHGGFDQLICLPLVREMEVLEHQVRTAKTVLRRFRGRALLCDEVGLGKTIEAGLVLDELALRGLARSMLVLTPPSLVEQWQGEMRRKFSLDFTAYDDAAFREAGARPGPASTASSPRSIRPSGSRTVRRFWAGNGT